jgi:hypothetical protein
LNFSISKAKKVQEREMAATIYVEVAILVYITHVVRGARRRNEVNGIMRERCLARPRMVVKGSKKKRKNVK